MINIIDGFTFVPFALGIAVGVIFVYFGIKIEQAWVFALSFLLFFFLWLIISSWFRMYYFKRRYANYFNKYVKDTPEWEGYSKTKIHLAFKAGKLKEFHPEFDPRYREGLALKDE